MGACARLCVETSTLQNQSTCYTTCLKENLPTLYGFPELSHRSETLKQSMLQNIALRQS